MQESLVMFPTDEQEPPLQNREFDARAYQFIRECGCPSLECCDLTPPNKSVKCLLDQACCQYEIRSGQSVMNGFAYQAMLLIPGARTPMEFGYQVWLAALQAITQSFSEKLVIAIPESLLIQRHEKEIGLLQLLQHRLAVCLAARLSYHSHHGLTERSMEPFKNGCLK